MADTAEQLVVSLEARIRDFERNFQKAARASNDNWNIIEARAQTGARKLETTVAQATDGIASKFKLLATSAAGAITAALGVSKLREYVDEWTSAKSKIAAAGEELDNVAKRQNELTDLANRSRTSLASVVDLYTGLTRSTKEMGASQAQVLRATELVSKAFATSGANVAETQGAITQLNQALGSGRLQGDELRSLLENAPALARLIAKEFGVAIGELKQLGSDGKLTSDRVFKAILNGAAEIEAEFAKTTPTIAQSWQVLTNSLIRYVGETDEAVGASKLVSGALKGMAENIDIVAPAAFSLAAGLAAAFAGGPVVGGITAATVALVGFSDKIHPIPGELASLADYAGVAWTLIKDKGGEAAVYIQTKFAEAVDHISAALASPEATAGLQDFLAGVKTLANAVIAAFDIAASTIKISFMSIGPTIAETMTNAVNHTIADIESMANKVIDAVNRIAKAFGQVGETPHIELGRVANAFEGSREEAGKAIGKAIREAIGKDYIGDIGRGLHDLHERANEAARKRREAAQPKPHDNGDINQPLKAPKDAEAAKAAEQKAKQQADAYAKIVERAKEFIQTQEIERQALQLTELEASKLRKEQELLNEATRAGIELTPQQRDQLKALADGMAEAEDATKQFANMQQQAQELADTLSSELTSALEGVLTGSQKIEDVWKRLALLFAKMALEAVLLGKGPLAGVLGIQKGGLFGENPLRGLLPSPTIAQSAASLTASSPTTPHASPASSTPATALSALTPHADASPVTPSAKAAWSFFRSKGYTDEETAKILGNLKQESGFNALARNPNDAGPGLDSVGIAQWNRGRFAGLRAFAEKQGKPWTDYQTQLAYVDHEIQGNPAYLHALKTRDAGGFGKVFEGFGDDSGPTRTKYADAFLKRFGGQDTTQQAIDAQRRLQDQMTKASQATQQIASPLQSMDTGVTKLAGSLNQGVPATDSFAGALEKLIAQLFSSLGGSGGAGV